MVNAQYVNAKKQKEKNEIEYHNHHNMAKRNIEIMTANLRRSLLQRNEKEYLASDDGTLVPRLLWKVGRGKARHLFIKENKRENSEVCCADFDGCERFTERAARSDCTSGLYDQRSTE